MVMNSYVVRFSFFLSRLQRGLGKDVIYLGMRLKIGVRYLLLFLKSETIYLGTFIETTTREFLFKL